MNFALVIADPVQTLARTISQLHRHPGQHRAGLRLLELGPRSPTPQRSSRNTAPPLSPNGKLGAPVGHITFDDITFRYPDGAENVLEHFSLDVPAGTTVAIGGNRRGQIHPGEPGLPVL